MALSNYRTTVNNASSGLRAIGYLGDLPDNLKHLAEDGDFIDWAKTVRSSIGASNRAFSTVDGLTKAYKAYKAGNTAASVAKAFNSGQGWVGGASGIGQAVGEALPWVGVGLGAYDLLQNGPSLGNVSTLASGALALAGVAGPYAAIPAIAGIGLTALGVGKKKKPDYFNEIWEEGGNFVKQDDGTWRTGYLVYRPTENKFYMPVSFRVPGDSEEIDWVEMPIVRNPKSGALFVQVGKKSYWSLKGIQDHLESKGFDYRDYVSSSPDNNAEIPPEDEAMTRQEMYNEMQAYLQEHPGDYDGMAAKFGIDQTADQGNAQPQPNTGEEGGSLADPSLMSQIETELDLPAGSFATYSQQYNDELSNAISELNRASTSTIPYQGMNLLPIGAANVAKNRVAGLASLLDPNEVAAKMAAQRDNLEVQGDIKSRLQQEQGDVNSRLQQERNDFGNDAGSQEELAKWLAFGRAVNQATGGAASGWVKKAIDRIMHSQSTHTGLSGVSDSANYGDFSFDSLELPDHWWGMDDDEFGQYLDDSGIFGGSGGSVIGNLDPGDYGLGAWDLSVFDSFEPEDLDWAAQHFDLGYNEADWNL